MSSPANINAPPTYEDILNLPDNVIGEIVDGELYTSPRPSPKHGAATTGIAGQVHGPFQAGRGGPGGWWIIIEPELHLGNDILVPDLAGWKKSRLPELPDGAFFELAPDWVCEVLSPSNARLDRVKKVPKYAEYDVKNLWLVDPLARIVEVFKLENKRWSLLQTFADKDKMFAEPFELIEIDLSAVWGD